MVFLLLHCNVQGPLTGGHSKLDYLRDLFGGKNTPDDLCITASKLLKSISDNEVAIHGYINYRRDRNINGGGAVTYCKGSLQSRRITDIECSHSQSK